MTSDTRIIAKLLSGQYDWAGEERDNYCVSYTNNSSFGNRYINWYGLWACMTHNQGGWNRST